MKKTVSMILTLVLLFTALPLSVFTRESSYADFYSFWDFNAEPVVLDLNQDGSPDTIKPEFYSNYYGHFNLVINEKRFTFAVERHGGYDFFTVVDIDPTDKFLDIILFDSYKGYVGASICRYDGENLFISGGYDAINAKLPDVDMDERYKQANIITPGDGSITFAFAPESFTYKTLNEFSKVDFVPVYLNGVRIAFDQPPVKEFVHTEDVWGDRILVPLRAIFEALGADVDWNDASQTVTAIKGNRSISLAIGSNILYINGEAKTLDATAILVNARTLVPVRAISEAFGCTVDWNDAEAAVYITQ